MLPIKQLGAISLLSPRQIIIQPWDRSYIESIERALVRESLGLSPIVEGTNIIINLPPMSEELRKEMIKTIAQVEDNAKRTIRKFRDEAWSEIQEKQGKEKLEKMISLGPKINFRNW